MLHLQVFTGEDEAVGIVAVDDDAAVAIEDFAARRKHRDGLDAVLLGLFEVAGRIADLQFPEAGNKKDEDANREVLKESDFAGSELDVFAQKASAG